MKKDIAVWRWFATFHVPLRKATGGRVEKPDWWTENILKNPLTGLENPLGLLPRKKRGFGKPK